MQTNHLQELMYFVLIYVRNTELLKINGIQFQVCSIIEHFIQHAHLMISLYMFLEG